MIAPQIPKNEIQRQKAVEKYQLLDTLSEESYDNITSLMSYVCETPISLITLLDNDRNFLKSHHGIPFNESPREISFCGHAINSEDPITIIEDSRKDERFHDNPLVTEANAIFYAGVPLVDSSGHKLGTLCVYDTQPRKLDEAQQKALLAMSKQVIHLFEQRLQNFELTQYQEKLQKRNNDLKKFAGIVSHDLKSPLANIISLTELLEDDNKGKLEAESLTYLEYLKSSSYSLKSYIDGLLSFYKSEDLIKGTKETVNFSEFVNELKLIADPKRLIEFTVTNSTESLEVNKMALMQVLINLINNAIKYNSKEHTRIQIDLKEEERFYTFAVKDNGDGIDPKHIDKIFDLFTVATLKDKDGNTGTGIGLATVKKIVKNLGGEITVESTLNKGSNFVFSIEK